jgi:thymidylate synthase (FAD)
MVDVVELYGDGIGEVRLISHMGTDKSVVNSARVSFNADDHGDTKLTAKDKKLIKYLADNKHTSPFEHCTVTFRVTVPLFVARQHMRHRTWSYNEVSRRYTSADINLYQPTEFRRQADNNRQASVEDPGFTNPVITSLKGTNLTWTTTARDALKSHHRKSMKLYNQMLKAGVSREEARMVLPQSMYTEYWCTANLLNILKFLKLRLASDAQVEIQEMAKAMAVIIKKLYPESYGAWLDV